MSDSVIDVAAWRERLGALVDDDVTAALVVQCNEVWLRPEFTAFRNEVDRALMAAHLRRGPSLAITRIILHNLPVAPVASTRAAAVGQSFDEWQHRLSAARALLSPRAASHQIHRLILRRGETAAVPDMVELMKDGEWTDDHQAEAALRVVGSAGATTPLTDYDVNLDGPFGDADPSVYM
ncbi:hypothetical protein ABZ023_30430 [Streptomyces sp. NPDC006367]|uniref:hypothetical protein n=1 Tax=unclassified Streptomyces TaxID=2593676 RepID=UPI0033A17F38